MVSQWNEYPAEAHLVGCLSDLGGRKSERRDSVSETDLGWLPGNDGQEIGEAVRNKELQKLERSWLG